MVKPVSSAHGSGWGSLGGWVVVYNKVSRTKDSGRNCNQRMKIK